MKYKVIVSDNRHESYEIEREILKSVDADLIIANCMNEDELINEGREADGILLDMAPCTKRVIHELNKCKVISRYGVGYDNVDINACTEKRIYVGNVPDYCAQDVSDHALSLFLASVRRVPIKDRMIREGDWNIKMKGIRRIEGKTFSLLGFGMIAKCFAKKISSLGLKKILVYDPYVSEI